MTAPKVGDRVQFTAEFCRNTGQYTGPDRPTSYGPFARGEVSDVGKLGRQVLLGILWDDGESTRVLACNVERTR